jgi:hypothetical protein
MKEKCKPKGYKISSIKKNNRKYPKSQENFAHPGTGSFQDTKHLLKIKPPHGMLSLKRQAQRKEKEH